MMSLQHPWPNLLVQSNILPPPCLIRPHKNDKFNPKDTNSNNTGNLGALSIIPSFSFPDDNKDNDHKIPMKPRTIIYWNIKSHMVSRSLESYFFGQPCLLLHPSALASSGMRECFQFTAVIPRLHSTSAPPPIFVIVSSYVNHLLAALLHHTIAKVHKVILGKVALVTHAKSLVHIEEFDSGVVVSTS
jgi:hypothetical protein